MVYTSNTSNIKEVSIMTDLMQHFYGIYDPIYDWTGIYDLNNIQLRLGFNKPTLKEASVI